ncbi:polar tube protein 2 [Hamiltosporidium magnivora]|uniref:Polar tube protein 2 n=1 Tax=Hamiltosporidium magnivora TaxID=148818 RepID=A0A4Q9LGP5_9MICR|nr:polar tube protein 2 [Hamiltosporidium magnivora]
MVITSGTTGGLGQQTTGSSKNSNAVLGLQQNRMLNTALNQLTAQQMSEPMAKAFIPGYNGTNLYCDPRGVEGNWQLVSQKLKQECIAKSQERNDRAIKLAKQLTQPKPQDCTVRISKGSMACHARKVLKDVITSPYYTLNMYGNVVEVMVGDEVVMMAVAENVYYDITHKSHERPRALKRPTASLEFNQLGGLLSQKGELPKPKKEDPCAACLEYLSKQTTAIEGQSENCGGCDSMMEITSVRSDSFRNVTKPNGQSSSTKPSKPAENGNEEGNGNGS